MRNVRNDLLHGLVIGERIALHVNLNKQCISAKQGKGPVVHLEGVTLELRDVTWSCPRKGFETATKQRHVFAKMRGVLVAIHEGNTVPFEAPRVRLNSRERSHVIMAEDCSLAYNLGWKDLRNQEMWEQNRHYSIHFHKLIPREFQQGNVLEMAFEKTLRT